MVVRSLTQVRPCGLGLRSLEHFHEISGLVVGILAEAGRWRRRDIEFIMRDVNPAADARAFLGATLCLGGTDNFNQ